MAIIRTEFTFRVPIFPGSEWTYGDEHTAHFEAEARTDCQDIAGAGTLLIDVFKIDAEGKVLASKQFRADERTEIGRAALAALDAHLIENMDALWRAAKADADAHADGDYADWRRGEERAA